LQGNELIDCEMSLSVDDLHLDARIDYELLLKHQTLRLRRQFSKLMRPNDFS